MHRTRPPGLTGHRSKRTAPNATQKPPRSTTHSSPAPPHRTTAPPLAAKTSGEVMAVTITDDAPARTTGRGRVGSPAAPAPSRRGKGRRSTLKGRTGSRQVVSRRGRRLTNTTADRSKVHFAIGSIIVVVLGIVLAMVLSGLSTSQSFQLSAARQEEQRLRDGISVLERDVEFQRSTAEIARRATEMGMVNVENPAILVV